jgi:hypothetical protein
MNLDPIMLYALPALTGCMLVGIIFALEGLSNGSTK